MTIAFKETTLDNGLRIVAEVDPTAHTAAIGYFVRSGARDEPAPVMGVSHFLEHMMFKGTATRTAADVDRDFDAIGANHNAFTTSEMTAFWSHCLPEHLDRAETILSDILRPALRQQDFDDEKSVILEEIAMYRDHPFWVLYERAMEAYYRDHPLGHRVLGTDETIQAMRRDEMVRYFETRYSADNTIVAMAGRLDFDGIAGRLRAHCGGWQRTDTARSHPAVTLADDDFTIESSIAHHQYLLMVAPAPPTDDDRRYAAAMLMQILGDVDGSRLHWALVETGLAEEAHAQYEGRDGLGEYLVSCVCAPEQADEVERIAREQAAALIGSVNADDLERVRNKVATAATLYGELPAGRMQRLGRTWTYTGRYLSLESELQKINAITIDDLRRVHDDFPIRPVVVGRLKPESG